VTVLTITLALLLGMVLFSAGIPVTSGGVSLHFSSAS
jgi:hypothetical protein